MNTYKAILINPTLKTINLVEINGLSSMQKHVDGTIGGVGYITPKGVVGGYDDDFIYINDEGLFDTDTDFVRINGYAQEIYRGNMLITGSDGQGGTKDVNMTVANAKSFIEIISKEHIRVNI